MARLNNEVAIVTGAGRGIGEAIARRFAAEGASVLVVDIDGDAAERVAKSLIVDGLRAASTTVDVAISEDAERMVAAAERSLGTPGVLINNAGISVFADPLELTQEDWRRCMSVDLEGVWHCTRAVLPGLLKAGRGSIVNIASVHSFKIIAGCFPYPVAKHGLIGLTRSLAVEYGPKAIRVNAICPSYIDTKMNADWFATMPDPDAARKRAEDWHPLRRMGTSDEVANAALFLASDEAGFITGESLMVDGGRSVVYHD